MKKLWAILLCAALLTTALGGCGSAKAKEQGETLTVYLVTNALYTQYAPYIQAQLPDVKVEFIVGQNDLDFYKFMDENNALPDIITCCRFSLHDAAPLKGSLMDLSTTQEAGTIYDTYLINFTNEDGSVNWLPVCGDSQGFVINKALFDENNIPIPTDYDSFVYACHAFEALGVRGYAGDLYYDYNCLSILQGLSIPELTSLEGRKWRTAYEDPASDASVGPDDAVWPVVFENMEKFIKDTNMQPDVVEFDYDPVINMFTSGEVAIVTGTSRWANDFRNQGMDVMFLPYFGQNGEQWMLTTPQWQVALNKDLENDKTRKEKAMRVLSVMLSNGAQSLLSNGREQLPYSKTVDLSIADQFANLTPLAESNHMYIRIASNDFFSASRDVVQKMITGEYNAQEAYEAFDAQLREPKDVSADVVLTSENTYSNVFYSRGGNEAYSVMANTLRNCYGSDVLLATGNSFTGSVYKTGYTQKMVGYMIMPNTLLSFRREMTGAELKEMVRAYVEGIEGGFNPFNRGALPVVSGIRIEVRENEGAYTLKKITKNGKPLNDEDTFVVTYLATGANFAPFLADESRVFEKGESNVKTEWIQFVTEGGAVLAEPENYITLYD